MANPVHGGTTHRAVASECPKHESSWYMPVMESPMRMGKRTAAPSAVLVADAEDARALALELAGAQCSPSLDPMEFGVVLEPGETAYRSTAVWLRAKSGAAWTNAAWCHALLTDERLIVRMPDATLGSFWWGSVVGFEVDVDRGHVVLDFGDGWPRLLSGSGVAVIAVLGIARLYGVLGTTPGPQCVAKALRFVRAAARVCSGASLAIALLKRRGEARGSPECPVVARCFPMSPIQRLEAWPRNDLAVHWRRTRSAWLGEARGR